MKSIRSKTIIGSADGPTSVFIVGQKNGKSHIPWKHKIKQFFYGKKRQKIISQIKADPHTLDELVEYLKANYYVKELTEADVRYLRQRKNCKAALVQRYRSDLLGEEMKMECPKSDSPEDIKIWLDKVNSVEEKAAAVPEELFPLDYHLYTIEYLDYGELHLEIEEVHQFMAISYTARSKKCKYMNKVAKDIYLYYGVSEEDIANKTERFNMLVMELAST